MMEIHDGSVCAVAATSDLIGSKWTALARPRPLRGPAPVHPARARLPRHQPAHALGAPAHARAGGDRLAPQLPGVAAARRVRADRKGTAMLPIIDAMSSFGHAWLIDDHDHEHTPPRASRAAQPELTSRTGSAHSDRPMTGSTSTRNFLARAFRRGHVRRRHHDSPPLGGAFAHAASDAADNDLQQERCVSDAP